MIRKITAVMFGVMLLGALIPVIVSASPYPDSQSVMRGKPLVGGSMLATDGKLDTRLIVGSPEVTFIPANPVEIDQIYMNAAITDINTVVFRINVYYSDNTTENYSVNIQERVAQDFYIDVNPQKKLVTKLGFIGHFRGTLLFEVDARKPPDTTPPPVPLNLQAISDIDRVRLSWEPVTGITDLAGYNVYRNSVRFNTNLITGSTFNAIKTGSHPYDTPYNWTVTAIDTTGNESQASTPAMASFLRPPDTTPPAIPTNLRGVPDIGKVDLAWNPNRTDTDLEGYLVYQDGALLFTQPIKTSTYTVTGGMSYTIPTFFQVAAIDTSGNISQKSVGIHVTPLQPADTTPPDDPTNLVANVTPDALRIRLDWTASNAADTAGYFIYLSMDGVNFSRINALPRPTTSYEIEPIESDKNYYIRVTAVDGYNNESGSSSTVNIKTPSKNTTITPGQPTSDYIDVSWTEVLGAVTYQILYNGFKVGEVQSHVFTYRITQAMGYNPAQLAQRVDVIPVFSNGSTGGSINPGGNMVGGGGWGFTPLDIFTSSAFIVASLSSLVLFGLAVRFAPQLINLIKDAVARRRAKA